MGFILSWDPFSEPEFSGVSSCWETNQQMDTDEKNNLSGCTIVNVSC